MKSLWEELNSQVEYYMKDFKTKYNMRFVKISPLKTLIVGKDFGLAIVIDRFDAIALYIKKEQNTISVWLCDSYFAEKFDDDDRIGLIKSSDVKSIIINHLKVLNNGLQNKWDAMLKGDKSWIDDYKKSEWYTEVRLTNEEMDIIKEYI